MENEHVDPEQVAEKEQAALRAVTNASLAKQGAVSKKQAALLWAAAAEEQQKIADEALEHQAEIEAETRVEEGTAAVLTSQVETVINKDEMIDVDQLHQGSRLRGSCYPLELHQVAGEDTSWSQEGCVCWNVASRPRSVASASAGQSGFHHRGHAGRSQRGVQQMGASTLAPQGGEQTVGGTALKRDGEGWSLADRTWVTT